MIKGYMCLFHHGDTAFFWENDSYQVFVSNSVDDMYVDKNSQILYKEGVTGSNYLSIVFLGI